MRDTVEAASKEVILELPKPEGGFGRFQIFEVQTMVPELAAKYPEIKTYRGVGIDDPTASASFEITGAEFSAMVLRAGDKGDTYLIDPVSPQTLTWYISYSKSDAIRHGPPFHEDGPITR